MIQNILTKNSKITELPSVGPSTALKLKRLGIENISQLIFHVPFRYKDTSQIIPINQFILEGEGTVKVMCEDISSVRIRQYFITKAKVFDKTGKLSLTWFNQPYISNSFKKGHQYIISGKYVERKGFKGVTAPQFEEVKADELESSLIHLGRITPFYDATLNLSTKWLRTKLFFMRDMFETIITEALPLNILEKYKLLSLSSAIDKIHFPENQKDILEARKRLAFDEVLKIAITIERQKLEFSKFQAPRLELPEKLKAKFLEKVPFELTKDQIAAISEISDDLEKNVPMKRLLNGDVGSGKTIVAVFACFIAISNGLSALVMSPTTILAQQHFKSFSSILENFGIRVVLHTSGSKLGQDDYKTPTVFITTHSILYEKEIPQNIGLVVIDEQHRFGVEQRETLARLDLLLSDINNKPTLPHYLSMTATPIPRTLTNVLYGDTEVSTIEVKPSNRLPVKSFYVQNAKKEACYQWVREKIVGSKYTEQAFFVFPLVDKSEKVEAKSVIEEYEKLSETVFKGLKIGLLHGQLKSLEKDKVIQDFKAKKYNILFATTVVEVGIDIPDATIIVIEDAERFGLAQLHQLRGRVGRGEKQAYCYVLSGDSEKSLANTIDERLVYFVTHSSGFEVAEYDLKSRGPGEVYGKMQSGVPNLKIANILDLKLINETRDCAKEILNKYSTLEIDEIYNNLFC